MARHCIYHEHYLKAARWAERAVERRPCDVSYSSLKIDEFFVDDLISLGKYQEAEALIRKLPPVIRLYPNNPIPMIAYRQVLLIKACVGLGRYETAILEAQKPLKIRDMDRPLIKLAAGEAFLAMHDSKAASLMLVDRGLSGWNSRLSDIFNNLVQLQDGDDGRARKIAQEAITFWYEYKYERIYELEVYQHIMLKKKCFGAAQMLSEEVAAIKQL